MLMNTPINPSPPVSSRVLGVRHVRARIEAPGAVLLGRDLVCQKEGTEKCHKALGIAYCNPSKRFCNRMFNWPEGP